jgi:hypothetical protein
MSGFDSGQGIEKTAADVQAPVNVFISLSQGASDVSDHIAL